MFYEKSLCITICTNFFISIVSFTGKGFYSNTPLIRLRTLLQAGVSNKQLSRMV